MASNRCSEMNDAGLFETKYPLLCSAPLPGTSGGASDGPTAGTTAATGDDGDSGGSMSPGRITTSAALAMPLGLALVTALHGVARSPAPPLTSLREARQEPLRKEERIAGPPRRDVPVQALRVASWARPRLVDGAMSAAALP